MITRVFRLVEDDGELSATLTTFDEDGATVTTEDVDLSEFPSNIIAEFFAVERPVAEVGDKVQVYGKDGQIVEVDDAGYATKINLDDDTSVNGVVYTYVDPEKAKADEKWQTVKKVSGGDS